MRPFTRRWPRGRTCSFWAPPARWPSASAGATEEAELIFRFLAALALGLHLAFILFVVGGGFLAWRWPRVRPVHLAAAAWGAFVALSGRVCPLTPLENLLLERAGRAGYGGGFIDRYLAPVVYPQGLTAGMQAGLGVFVVVFNVAVYAIGQRRFRRPSTS